MIKNLNESSKCNNIYNPSKTTGSGLIPHLLITVPGKAFLLDPVFPQMNRFLAII
jgi:hypothetical protein